MKTNRTSIRRIALIAGAIWMASQGVAQAATTASAPQGAQAQVEQPRVLLASTSCTRVGTRMVC